MDKIINRFIEYCQIDTQSDENSTTSPSTFKQFDLANLLVKQLHEMGIDNAYVDDKCYVYATIKGNVACDKTVGFIAHMDTADFKGSDVKPRVISNYDGKDIRLNDEYSLTIEAFPNLLNHVGKTLIVTDGTTLLGADDKAGITAIMEAVSYLTQHPDVSYPTFKICFTPDEEVGRGTESFDIEGFGCDFAYTLDGGEIDVVCDETFNAASAKVKVSGFSIHPGDAKNKMINAINVLMQYHHLIPSHMLCEHTENREGFYHLMHIEGNVEQACGEYIIREHDFNKLERMLAQLEKNAEYINDQYDNKIVEIDVKYQYRNMYEVLKDKPEIMQLAMDSLKELGLHPYKVPVRGGTDGANLTFNNLPCPNLGTGGYNYHGRYEYLVVEELVLAKELILKILSKLI